MILVDYCSRRRHTNKGRKRDDENLTWMPFDSYKGVKIGRLKVLRRRHLSCERKRGAGLITSDGYSGSECKGQSSGLMKRNLPIGCSYFWCFPSVLLMTFVLLSFGTFIYFGREISTGPLSGRPLAAVIARPGIEFVVYHAHTCYFTRGRSLSTIPVFCC